MLHSSAFPSSSPSPRRRTWSLLVPVLAVAILAAVAVCALVRPGVHTMPGFVAPPPPAAAWRITVAADGPQEFGGRFVPGQIVFLPAGAAFTVQAEPSGAQGMFVEAGRAVAWDHAGGETNPQSPSPYPLPQGEGEKEATCGHVQHCRAPLQPGLYRLAWTEGDTVSSVPQVAAAGGSSSWQAQSPADSCRSLQVLVLARAELHTQSGRTQAKVARKSIGFYHDPAQAPVKRVRENARLYQPPHYFATLTPETLHLQLGPGFELGQLVAFKDYYGADGRKVYTTERHTDVLPPRPELVDKLVKLRERLRARGVKVTRFWITSGFRTPAYNHSIGGACYSRHCFGDAVDLLIDEDGDKHMDDLNGDGRADRKDGIIIGNACRELEAEGAVTPGGIGVYEWDSDDSVRSHVHIDCRGYVSRWGQDGAGRYKKTFTWWPKAEFQEEETGE